MYMCQMTSIYIVYVGASQYISKISQSINIIIIIYIAMISFGFMHANLEYTSSKCILYTMCIMLLTFYVDSESTSDLSY